MNTCNDLPCAKIGSMKKLSLLFCIFTLSILSISAQKTGGIKPIKDNPSKWYSQSNIYEVNLRQYSVSGSINDFAKHLPRLKKMGVEILWFMPITPIGVEGRKMTEQELGSYYAVKNYKAFSSEFGTMAQWKTFVKKAHANGFKVITDWVPNHSSPDNHWITSHPDFYVKDSNGVIIPPNPDWTDTRKLNYDNRELRDSMIDAMKFWLTETDIDGFRCDVAGDVPDDFWKECIPQLRKTKKNIFMLAEADKPSLIEDGFDATYAWSTMGAMTDLHAGKKTLTQFDSVLTSDINRYPKKSYRLFFTSNHDENSWNGTEFEKYGDAYKTFAVFTQTMYQSVPLIYSGQEVPNKKRLKFFVKDSIEWKGFAMAPFYKQLLTLRRNNPALAAYAAYNRLKTSADEYVFAYTRQNSTHRITIILNMSNHPQKFTINDPFIYGNPLNVFLGQKEKLFDGHEFSLEPWGFIVYDHDK
jgi:alpha-amylase